MRKTFALVALLALGCESESIAPPDGTMQTSVAKLRDFVVDSFHLSLETEKNGVRDYLFQDPYLTFTRDEQSSSAPWTESLGQLKYWKYAFTIDSASGSLDMRADFAIPQHEGTVQVNWKAFTYDSVAKTIEANIVDLEPLIGNHLHVVRDHGIIGPGQQGWITTYRGSVDARTDVKANLKLFLK